MQPVLTAEAMREADRFTIEEYGIPSFTLMESAGRKTTEQILQHFGPAAALSVTCFCGKGNNGGDGLVVARQLYAHGARVRVVTMSMPENMSEEARRNARLLRQLQQHDDGERLSLHRFEDLRQVAAYPAPDLYVDALLGTGLTSELRDPIRSLVTWLNEQSEPTVAIDMPTGLHSDRGVPLGTAVEAELTVTMAALKSGLVIGEGPTYAGTTVPVEIGIPPFVLADAVRNHPGCAWRPSDADVRAWLPERPRDAHKYTAGLAVVAGGAPGMTGAPVMASAAAARIGAGAVVCACAEDIQPTLASKLTEVMTLALPSDDNEGIEPTGALEALHARLDKANSLLVGPGLGRAASTQRFVHTLLEAYDGPAVIDADGLNALAERPAFISEHAGGRWILTPHAGEFKRLAGKEADLSDRLRTAQEHAARWKCVLLLKGNPSVVAGPNGTTYVNATGNPALASAGTGDILAGLCTGLLAQGLPPVQAAASALHLGGAAADRYTAHRHPHTLMAMDLLNELSVLLHDRFQS